jgi:putative transposase
MVTSTQRQQRSRSSRWRAGYSETGPPGSEGGHAEKDQPKLAPRCVADPTRTVREQFLVELSTPDTEGSAVADLATLNRLFVAWVETVYHPRVHTSTGAPPLARWRDGLTHPVALPTPARLREAFLWSAQRTVTKTATVSLHGNVYQVDPVLVGRAVELVFDPFDLADVEVRYRERSYGTATVFRIGRHSHPKARPELPDLPPVASGIDYLRLVGTAHDTQLGERVNYHALAGAPAQGVNAITEPGEATEPGDDRQEPTP